MFGFRKRNEEVDIPDQSFVQELPIEISAAHPLKIRRITKPILFFLIAALFIFCGVYGIRMPYEDATQQSANIAAGVFFFILGALFIALMILTYRTKVVVKEVKGEVIGVWVGLRKRIVFLNNRQVYKGRDNIIEIQGRRNRVKVYVSGKVVYFK